MAERFVLLLAVFFFSVNWALFITDIILLSFLNRWHQLAAHSQSSQSPPCWVAETLALRRSVFLASSAVFQPRDPDGFYPINRFLKGRCGHWEIRCRFTSGHDCMERGEGLFLLSSGFNSTLSEYRNTKLWRKTILILRCLFRECLVTGLRRPAPLMDGDREDQRGWESSSPRSAV